MSASEEKMHKLQMDGFKPASDAIKLLESRERLVFICILYNNMVNVFATSVFTLLFFKLFGEQKLKLGFFTFLMSIVFFLFCESIPKTIGVRKSNSIIITISWFHKILLKISSPLIYCIDFINKFISKKISEEKNQHDEANESILGTIEMYYQRGAIKEEYREMLSNVLNLEKYDISSVMTQRGDIYSISINDNFDEIYSKIVESKYSKIPVFNEFYSNVIGTINVAEFLRNFPDQKSKEFFNLDKFKALIKIPYFIPEGASLKSQLPKFKEHGSKIGFVVDEYGSIIGMVTIEDIVEHIIGDISDSNDNSNYFTEIGSDEFLVKGETPIREVNERINSRFEDNHFLTIAGLIMDKMEKMPNQQDSIDIDGFRFTILEIEKNRICKIRLKKIQD